MTALKRLTLMIEYCDMGVEALVEADQVSAILNGLDIAYSWTRALASMTLSMRSDTANLSAP